MKKLKPTFKRLRLPKQRTEAEAERLAFYNSERWRRLRKAKLSCSPICSQCGDIATTVHHKIERLDNPKLSYDWDNLQSLCSYCHSQLHRGKR